MKPMRTFGIFLLLLLLLTSCSVEEMLERGNGVLDKMFAGEHIPSTPQPDPTPEPTPEPAPDPVPTGGGAEEPDIPPELPDVPKPTVPSGPVTGSEPEPPQSVQEPQTDSKTSGEVTPSHTDVTFFGPGESFRYLPEGISGTYACTYTAGDSQVASVDPDNGRVTAVGPGMTKIKMHVESSGQYDFECVVRCNWKDEKKEEKGGGEPVLPPESTKPSKPAGSSEPPEAPVSDGVSASHSDATFFNPKESFRLLPQGAGDDYTCTYSTSDADVAAVDGKTGRVTAVGPGTANITMCVDCGGTEYTFTCIVRCSW